MNIYLLNILIITSTAIYMCTRLNYSFYSFLVAIFDNSHNTFFKLKIWMNCSVDLIYWIFYVIWIRLFTEKNSFHWLTNESQYHTLQLVNHFHQRFLYKTSCMFCFKYHNSLISTSYDVMNLMPYYYNSVYVKSKLESIQFDY